MQSVEEFPGTVELELTKTQIHMIPYKHYDEKSEFDLDPLQQFLGMLQRIAPLKASNPLQPFRDLLQPICRQLFKLFVGRAFAFFSAF